MKLNRDILKQLPLALRVQIEAHALTKPYAQSELAATQRRILEELRKHAKPGTRTDLAETSAKDFAQVNRASRLVGALYGESDRQVEKRLAVVDAAENAPEKDRERFGALVAHMDRTGNVHQAYAELRRIQIEESEALPAEGVQAEVIVGDFRIEGHAVADNSVDLIFTDPPYARKFVPLFGDLAQFAARTLIEGSSLLTYCGHHSLLEVLTLMTSHLQFFWPCALVHSSGQHKMVPGMGVGTGWHPLLWFTKGKRRRPGTLVSDCIRTDPGNKISEHDWAQGTHEALYYIGKLSRKGSLVVDPFLGSGTTGVAAVKAARCFTGFEIDPATARKAEARIKRLQRSGE